MLNKMFDKTYDKLAKKTESWMTLMNLLMFAFSGFNNSFSSVDGSSSLSNAWHMLSALSIIIQSVMQMTFYVEKKRRFLAYVK